MASTYEVVLVARTPQSAAAPTLTVVAGLTVEGIDYTEELNRAGSATLSCPISSLTPTVKARLASLATAPSEAWIYRDTDLVWAGEVQTLGLNGQNVQLNCAGLLAYTSRMGVTADLVYTGTDQFVIAKGLVDHWQNQSYGNYGLDTSGIGTSGVTRDRTYLRNDLHNIGTRLLELGAVDDGFDVHVDPATRDLVLSYPQRGADLTDSVFLDRMSIDSAAIAISVAPGDLVSDISATGTTQSTSGQGSALYSARGNATLRATYGRSWAGESFDGVSVQSTLDGHGDAYLSARSTALFQPGVTALARPGAAPGDFGPGDVISYSYDAGLGEQSGEFRVSKVSVKVDSDGSERISVEFV